MLLLAVGVASAQECLSGNTSVLVSRQPTVNIERVHINELPTLPSGTHLVLRGVCADNGTCTCVAGLRGDTCEISDAPPSAPRSSGAWDSVAFALIIFVGVLGVAALCFCVSKACKRWISLMHAREEETKAKRRRVEAAVEQIVELYHPVVFISCAAAQIHPTHLQAHMRPLACPSCPLPLPHPHRAAPPPTALSYAHLKALGGLVPHETCRDRALLTTCDTHAALAAFVSSQVTVFISQ
jgi:hypothetical protein